MVLIPIRKEEFDFCAGQMEAMGIKLDVSGSKGRSLGEKVLDFREKIERYSSLEESGGENTTTRSGSIPCISGGQISIVEQYGNRPMTYEPGDPIPNMGRGLESYMSSVGIKLSYLETAQEEDVSEIREMIKSSFE